MHLRDIWASLDLLLEPRRVLIVEDHLPLAARLQEFLLESNHNTTACVGIHAIESSVAQATSLVGEPISINLAEVQVVFLDHFFLSKTYTGSTFLKELLLVGSPKVLAMSSDPDANATMLALGATVAIRKSELISMLD